MNNQQAFSFDILKYRLVAAGISLSILLAAGVMYMSGKRFTYSVDFTGGTQVQMQFATPMTSDTLRSILSNAGWPRISTRSFGEKDLLIRVSEVETDAKGLGERIRQAIIAADPESSPVIMQSESVGKGIGASLRYNSLKAIFFGLLAMLMYILVRFWSLGFAFGSVVALAHDALIMLALFLLFDREISTNVIAAILAVLGYSINDTIVIFSQIRTNMHKMSSVSLYDIVNRSINQTLRRTMLTSISTGLPVASMLIVGGEALRDISLALMIGIVFGTFSSIFIASPIMMLFTSKKQ